MNDDEITYQVCEYLRSEPCERCTRVETGYGSGEPACKGIARETVSEVVKALKNHGGIARRGKMEGFKIVDDNGDVLYDDSKEVIVYD